MEIIRYKVDPADGRRSGWLFEGHGQDAPSKDGSTVLAQAVALLSRSARLLQVVKIPNTEYQDVPPHFGILLEDR